MNIFQSIISEEWITILGWSLLHSLWQGALIALILGIVLLFLQKKSSNLRYVLSASALVLVLVAFLGTFVYLYQNTTTQGASEMTYIVIEADQYQINQQAITAQEASSSVFMAYFQQHLPVIVIIWLLGVLVLSLRFLGGLAYVQRLKYAQNRPLSDLWSNKMLDISARLGIKKSVSLLESALITVPMVVGYLKPIILLPIGTVNALSQAEVEAILAHELAHIRRHDYLINLVQSMIDVLFFYHPAIWWMSNTVRAERENCCDDLALQVTGNSLIIAKALASLEAIRLNSPLLSVAFTGQKNQLLNRISRLLGQQKKKNNFIEGFIAVAIIIICLTTMNYKVNAKNDLNENLLTTTAEIDTIIPETTKIKVKVEDEGEVIEEYVIIEEEIEIPSPPTPLSPPRLITLDNGTTKWVNTKENLATFPKPIAPPSPIEPLKLKLMTLSNGTTAWVDTENIVEFSEALVDANLQKTHELIQLGNGKTTWVNKDNNFLIEPIAPSLKWTLDEISSDLFDDNDLIKSTTRWKLESNDTSILDRIDDHSEIIIIDGDQTIIIRKKTKTSAGANVQRQAQELKRHFAELQISRTKRHQKQAKIHQKHAERQRERAEKKAKQLQKKAELRFKVQEKKLKAENKRMHKHIHSKSKKLEEREAERKLLKERLEYEKVIRKEERSRMEAERKRLKAERKQKKIKLKVIQKELIKDGFLKEGQTIQTINIKAENNKKVLIVNGKQIPKNKVDKYIKLLE